MFHKVIPCDSTPSKVWKRSWHPKICQWWTSPAYCSCSVPELSFFFWHSNSVVWMDHCCRRDFRLLFNWIAYKVKKGNDDSCSFIPYLKVAHFEWKLQHHRNLLCSSCSQVHLQNLVWHRKCSTTQNAQTLEPRCLCHYVVAGATTWPAWHFSG